MNMQHRDRHGHAAWIWSMDIRHGYAAWTYSKNMDMDHWQDLDIDVDMQNGNGCRYAAWT
jgi:hypothetical protein